MNEFSREVRDTVRGMTSDGLPVVEDVRADLELVGSSRVTTTLSAITAGTISSGEERGRR